MGKGKRLRHRTPDPAADSAASDAAELMYAFRQWADKPARSRTARQDNWVATATRNMLRVWDSSQVVLRCDRDFADALIGSDTDAPLPPAMLATQPFEAFAVTLPVPMTVHDGTTECRYRGCLVTGVRHEQPKLDQDGYGTLRTHYVPLAEADGVRFLWLFTTLREPGHLRAQTITINISGAVLDAETTIREMIERHLRLTEHTGDPWGSEFGALIPLSMQLLVYLTAHEPDIDWPAPPPRRNGASGSSNDARLGHIGFRVGADLRAANVPRTGTAGARRGSASPRAPHPRRGYWRRVRVVTRDDAGAKVGSVQGVHGVDWHYALRWIPPITVNAHATDPHHTVRTLK